MLRSEPYPSQFLKDTKVHQAPMKAVRYKCIIVRPAVRLPQSLVTKLARTRHLVQCAQVRGATKVRPCLQHWWHNRDAM